MFQGFVCVCVHAFVCLICIVKHPGLSWEGARQWFIIIIIIIIIINIIIIIIINIIIIIFLIIIIIIIIIIVIIDVVIIIIIIIIIMGPTRQIKANESSKRTWTRWDRGGQHSPPPLLWVMKSFVAQKIVSIRIKLGVTGWLSG